MLRVLIVDDAMFMRNLLREVFEKAGHSVVGEAANGAEAVEKYRQLRPDVVLMDIVMPDSTGLDALREIAREDAQACVIMCSALGQEKLVMDALAAGARDFIVKPFKEDQVLTAVARAVEAPRA